jgi:hypothetical protein
MKTRWGRGESNIDFMMLECLLFQGEKCLEQIKAVENCIPLAGVQVRSIVANRTLRNAGMNPSTTVSCVSGMNWP